MHIHRRCLAVGLIVALAACGDSGTEVDVPDELTPAEAEALAEAVGMTVLSTWSEDDSEGSALAAPAPFTVESDLELEVPCKLGGSVAIEGTVRIEGDEEARSTTLDYAVTHMHQACTVQSKDGVVFTLNGAPHVTANLHVETGGNVVLLSGDYGGAVDWTTEEKEGTCPLSAEFSFELDLASETLAGSLEGTVCGVTLSRSVTGT